MPRAPVQPPWPVARWPPPARPRHQVARLPPSPGPPRPLGCRRRPPTSRPPPHPPATVRRRPIHPPGMSRPPPGRGILTCAARPAGRSGERSQTMAVMTAETRPRRDPPVPARLRARAPDRRRARGPGKAARAEVPRESHAAARAALGPARPGQPAGGAVGRPGAGAGPGPLRPDAGLAVHLLPRGGPADGQRPGRHAGHRAGRAGLRRRPPVQLRHLRLARAPPGLRRQRLRRDPARPVGVGRQAAGRQPGGRRAAATGSPASSAGRS